MKTCWIFGDSHAAGSGILNNDYAKEYLESYPCQLARALGYKNTLNHSIGGHSNDAIFRWVTENAHNINADDLVILCWSELARSEIWSDSAQQWLYFVRAGNNDETYRPWNSLVEWPNALQGMIGRESDHVLPPGLGDRHLALWQEWQKNLGFDKDRKTIKLNWIKNVLAANLVLHQRGVMAMNICSVYDVHACLDRLPDELANQWWPVGATVFRNWALDQGFNEDQRYHLPMTAHTAFADHVYTQIRNTR